MNISDLVPNDTATVIGFNKNNKAYRKKLLTMGITPGTTFSVTRFAPMGDPIEIKIRGYSLTLRRDEATIILVEKYYD